MATVTLNEIGGGNIVGMSNETTWNAARTAATADTINTGDFMEATKIAANNWNLRRSLMWFDTSALSGVTINSAKLIHAAISNRTNDDTCTMHVVNHTGTDSTIVQADFDQTQTTSFGSVLLGSLSTGGTTDITLNASGIAAINTSGGHTALAIIFDRDKDNSDPTGVNQYQCNPTGHQLYIDYTPASTSGFFALL